MLAPATQSLSETAIPVHAILRASVPEWLAAYEEVWLGDFEFRPADSAEGARQEGHRPFPICYCATELFTGRRIRLWFTEFPETCPHRVDKKVLYVAYMAAAEMLCFVQLGWHIFCLYVMFMWVLGGRATAGKGGKRGKDDDEKPGYGLVDARQWFGLPHVITKVQKERMRDRILAGGEFSVAEQESILDYCESDNDIGLLLKLAAYVRDPKDALHWGLFQWACATIEWRGVPIDTVALTRILDNWESIKEKLVAELDVDYGCFEGTTFKATLFEQYLERSGLLPFWPRTPTGRLRTDESTWDRECDQHPELSTLWQLRGDLNGMRKMQLPIGPDGRNRFGCRAFGTKTSRNAARGSDCILLKSSWLRFLVRPQPGWGIGVID
jgi:DNA polymerase I